MLLTVRDHMECQDGVITRDGEGTRISDIYLSWLLIL